MQKSLCPCSHGSMEGFLRGESWLSFVPAELCTLQLPNKHRRDPTPSLWVLLLGMQGPVLKWAESQMMSRCVAVYPIKPGSFLLAVVGTHWWSARQLWKSLCQNQVLCAFTPILVHVFPLVVTLNTSLDKVHHFLSDMGNASCPEQSCQLQKLLKTPSLIPSGPRYQQPSSKGNFSVYVAWGLIPGSSALTN